MIAYIREQRLYPGETILSCVGCHSLSLILPGVVDVVFPFLLAFITWRYSMALALRCLGQLRLEICLRFSG